MKVLEVEGCRSSVVKALMAEASGPGFDSRRQPRFFIFFLCFFPDPFRLENFYLITYLFKSEGLGSIEYIKVSIVPTPKK